MVANVCLLSCALLTAQAPDRSEWQLAPRLVKGQELVYHGSFAEEALGKGVQFSRSYRLESRVFVLDAPQAGTKVAFYTVLKLRTQRGDRSTDPDPSSVRLELARVDLQGRLTPEAGVSFLVPLEGPATVETGALLETPRGRLMAKQTWQAAEENRPPRTWRVLGPELVSGTRCVKLEGLQQTEDWDRPRGDHAAWRRRDTVWIDPRLGMACRVERVVERRDAAHRDPTQRSVTQYELQSNIQYPGQLYEDRTREILSARAFYDRVAPLLPNPTRVGPRQFDAVLSQITRHLDNQAPTPYREAIVQVRRRVEAAKRGEMPPLPPVENAGDTPTVATLGCRAPEFLATNVLTHETTRLKNWLGQPVLLVFYTPTSHTTNEVLRYAERLLQNHMNHVHVLALAVTEDVTAVRTQHEELRLSYPVLAGNGLRHSFGVDATPRLVLLDADGVVRGAYSGWGPETPGTVTEELRNWLRPNSVLKSEPAGRPVQATPTSRKP